MGNIANAKNFDPNKHKYYGRFNQGVVTISLPDIAFSSDGDFDKFWEIFEERTELCHKALRARHERLLGTSSDVAPILWQHGAYARLKKHTTIHKNDRICQFEIQKIQPEIEFEEVERLDEVSRGGIGSTGKA